MSHIPLPQQTAMSGRAIEGIVVGNSPRHEFGLRIFNPATKHESIRHTYKNLGESEQISPTYVLDDSHQPHQFILQMSEASALLLPSSSHKSDPFVSPVLPSTCPYISTYTPLRQKEAPSVTHRYFDKIGCFLRHRHFD